MIFSLRFNSVIFKIGLTVQVLVLVGFFFLDTPAVMCSELTNTKSEREVAVDQDHAVPLVTSSERSDFGSLISLEFSGLKKESNDSGFNDASLISGWLKYLLVAGGLMGLVGLLLKVLRRKKIANITSGDGFHLCSLRPVLTPLSYQLCNQCDAFIKYSDNKLVSKRPEIWVIEITTLSEFEHQKSAAAIKKMKLAIIRMENNFIVVGPYESKLVAAKIVGRLNEYHNVRGWLTPGN